MRHLTILAACFLAVNAAAAEPDLDALVSDSRAAVKAFGEALKAELVAAIEAGGPVHAIQVCNAVAPGIAAAQSEAFAGTVGRTSLKPRNPANAPDAWERGMLKAFEARKERGEDPATLEHAEIVDQGGRRLFRYMKAIPTAEVCLTCHGADLDPDLAAALDALYPADQARGFKLGDLRGAFTVSKPLD